MCVNDVFGGTCVIMAHAWSLEDDLTCGVSSFLFYVCLGIGHRLSDPYHLAGSTATTTSLLLSSLSLLPFFLLPSSPLFLPVHLSVSHLAQDGLGFAM